MSTGTKVIQNALARIGAHSPIKPASSESMETGRDVLNSMIAQWMDDNIEIGAVPLEAVGSELSEPLGTFNPVVDNLAILLQPYFPASQISQEVRKNAEKGYQYILGKYQTVTVPKKVVRGTLPAGQGNRYDIFFDEGDELGS
jgi:hypothetical protein